MSTITPNYRTVQQLLQSQTFCIDEYQREYKWEKDNIEELLSDLHGKFLSCYQKSHDTQKVATYEDYFLGSIIVSKRNGKNYLIDGQQRITSLTLLLIYLRRAAQKQSLPVAGRLEPLLFFDDNGTYRFNLDIPERLPVIEALFNNTPFTPDGKDESIQTMCARFGDIESRDLVGELDEALPHFVYWLMSKVGLIEIATDNDNYAYAIFETMNDRGKPLSPVDMLKAYLLAPIENAEARRSANTTWKRQVLDLISWSGEHEPERDANCIKAWLRAQHAESIRERKAGSTDKDWELIGSAFHRWARDNRVRLNLGGATENLALMQHNFPFFAKAYLRILDAGKTYTPGLEAVFYNADNEFTWQNTVLLAPLCVTDDAATVDRKLAATATYLDIWLMRRTVNYIRVGYSSTAYAMWLLSKDIRGKSLPELVQILIQKLANDDVTFDGSASKGRLGINGLELNQFTGRYIYHLLARLTAYVESQSGKPDLFDKYVDRSGPNPCDIEHICADNHSRHQKEFPGADEFQSWRNHVAGLLLLPADVNRSLQDKVFEDKSPTYAAQNLYAASLTPGPYRHQPRFAAFRSANNLPFRPFEKFGRAEQAERRVLVHALVHKVWAPNRIKELLP
jgi:uncharacterized protein with ParB-like and HNH nuclease domain